MSRWLGWLCWHIITKWPLAWPSNRLCDWMLAWAGYYGFEEPKP